MNNNKGSVALLLMGLIIISMMAYFSFMKHTGEPKKTDPSVQTMAEQAGLDTSSATAILESAKDKIKEVEKLQAEQQATQSLKQQPKR